MMITGNDRVAAFTDILRVCFHYGCALRMIISNMWRYLALIRFSSQILIMISCIIVLLYCNSGNLSTLLSQMYECE